MRPETIATEVIQSRIKVPLEDSLTNPACQSTMYVRSAYEAVVEAIKIDRKKRAELVRRSPRGHRLGDLP
jgi:hypothetical protein